MVFRRNPASLDNLRTLAKQRFAARSASNATTLSIAEAQQLFEELEIHQIELELQNEELRTSRALREALLARYTELYDFAPVGYFTLARDGTILQTNLLGASLLGIERSNQQGRRFGLFVEAA